MKKVIMVSLILVSVFVGIKAYAAVKSMTHVDTLVLPDGGDVYKIYDENSGAICYVYYMHGISCVK